jgi:hypothetical protein
LAIARLSFLFPANFQEHLLHETNLLFGPMVNLSFCNSM